MRWLFVLLLLLPLTQAATLSGNVYDLSLQKVPAVVSLSNQQFVAVNGSFSFEVGPGTYLLSAEQFVDSVVVASANESVLIQNDSVFDLILFPVLEEVTTPDLSFETFEEESQPSTFLLAFLSVLSVLVIISLFLSFRKKKPKELSKELQELVDFLRSQGGRSTQKEIRQQFPLSEAKVSLMITELEDRGFLKRIKRGRGNVIVLI